MSDSAVNREQLFAVAIERWMNDLAGHGILITDADLKIRAWNRWLEEHSTLPADEVLGHNLLEVYSHLERRRLDRQYKWVLEGQTRVLSQRLHGHLIPLPSDPALTGFTEMQQTARISPLLHEGNVIGTVTVIDDVTERVAREAELQAQVDAKTLALARERASREEAEEANRLKDDFLATISHELRTPLTAILGWSTMLLRSEKSASDTQLRALEIIHRNAQAQKQLISDLLDVSRIISGKLRLDLRTVELQPIINAAIESSRPMAETKGVELIVETDPRSVLVSGDADRLQQVVWNLMTNAVKFTPAGGRVVVRSEVRERNVVLTIRDNGIGISREFLPHIFDRFRQADPSTNRVHGGMGLGLSIVRQLVELHGGNVVAESEGKGQGATFVISLPIMVASEKIRQDQAGYLPPLEPAQLDCPPILRGLHVLVVDDEADTREMLAVILEQCDCNVMTARSVTEAMDAFVEFHPDILVSDLSMPGEDGYELIARVRTLSEDLGGKTPAVALTASARAEDRMRVLRSGFQLHVPKPVEPAELIAVVASLAERSRSK